MGNTCTRSEHHVTTSDDGVCNYPTYQEQLQRSGMTRGRWSTPGYEGSVDLDALIAAPSPPPRKKTLRVSSDETLVRAASSTSMNGERNSKDRKKSFRLSKSRDSAEVAQKRKHFYSAKIKTHRGRITREASNNASALLDLNGKGFDHLMMDSGDSIDMLDFDSDLILQSPADSPSVIHARWGEPIDDPEQLNTCMEFDPNPFKLGFCVNCQKQHDVTSAGDVVTKKEFKKITRPTVSKTAANALENPAAIKRIMSESGRESDVDLALLLKQRREILLRLQKMEMERTHRKENFSRTSRVQSRSMYVHEKSEAPLRKLQGIASIAVDDSSAYNPRLYMTTRSALSKSICAASVMQNVDGRSENVWI